MTRPAPERLHRGDIMSVETRSRVMSRIRGRGTTPERIVEQMICKLGYDFENHVRDLPGRPDFVLRSAGVVVLVDGDFWHGWRFHAWRLKLSEKWEAKIAANIRRDTRNRRLLREGGWIVVRLWEHQVTQSPKRCRARIRRAVRLGLQRREPPGSLGNHTDGSGPE